MKRFFKHIYLILILTILVAPLSIEAQYVTYNHDDSKMNQFTVAEIGSGALTPELYYQILHNNYRKTAAVKNKLSFRTEAGVAAYMQIDDATKLDSAMIKRAEIEALNIADRTGGALDLAWMAEGEKITKKLSDFRTNIDRILQYGGTPNQQNVWLEHYNILQTAIKSTQEAYMPNSQRKKEYLSIYADAAKKNESLIRYLVYLSNSKTTASLLRASYEKQDRTSGIVAEAMSRWRDAGWQSVSNRTINSD